MEFLPSPDSIKRKMYIFSEKTYFSHMISVLFHYNVKEKSTCLIKNVDMFRDDVQES